MADPPGDPVLGERLAGTERLLLATLSAMEKAADLQTRDFDRRMLAMAHEHDMLAARVSSYVLLDTYNKDMERTYTERKEHNAMAAAGRIALETSAATGRRANVATLITALLALMGMSVSLLGLHFGH